MQNYKKYAIPPAQLIIADVPYNVGNNFYGSNPMWYNKGDNKNGESRLAGKAAFNSDFNFNLYEYFHFCSKMMKKDDKKPVARGRSSDSPCMIVFCSFEQVQTLISAAKKLRGTGRMVFNWFEWEKDGKDIPKIHPAQKSVKVLKKLIETFTDPGDVVIDPCAGSGTTLRAAWELGRSAYGFEIDRTFYTREKEEMIAGCNGNPTVEQVELWKQRRLEETAENESRL